MDEDFQYVKGHVVDGRNLFPATGYLCLVWQTLGMMIGKLYTDISVVFDNVRFIRATTLSKEGSVEMTVMIQKGNCFLSRPNNFLKNLTPRSNNKQEPAISKWLRKVLLLLRE